MKKTSCVILSYEITKGMKSYGPIGLLKSTQTAKELILHQIDSLNKIFDKPSINIVCGFGADKIYKKLPKGVGRIYNDKFEHSNQGYALKLILSNFDDTIHDGLFLIEGGVLLRSSAMPRLPSFKNSWVLNRKTKKQDRKGKFIGSVTDSTGAVDYIFYDVGELAWCNSVFFSTEDIINIKKSSNTFYDNMFLFEIINKSISNKIAKYHNVVMPNESFIMIEGIKDKHKIKEIS